MQPASRMTARRIDAWNSADAEPRPPTTLREFETAEAHAHHILHPGAPALPSVLLYLTPCRLSNSPDLTPCTIPRSGRPGYRATRNNRDSTDGRARADREPARRTRVRDGVHPAASAHQSPAAVDAGVAEVGRDGLLGKLADRRPADRRVGQSETAIAGDKEDCSAGRHPFQDEIQQRRRIALEVPVFVPALGTGGRGGSDHGQIEPWEGAWRWRKCIASPCQN